MNNKPQSSVPKAVALAIILLSVAGLSYDVYLATTRTEVASDTSYILWTAIGISVFKIVITSLSVWMKVHEPTSYASFILFVFSTIFLSMYYLFNIYDAIKALSG